MRRVQRIRHADGRPTTTRGRGILTVLAAAVRSSAKPGFVDRLIQDQYRRASARMATFEHAAGRLAGTTVLAARRRRR